jgi:hypothetical protein
MTFKVRQLAFDEHEEVAFVVAEVDDKTYKVLSDLTGEDLRLRIAKLDDPPRVSLTRDAAVKVFRALGKVDGHDPRRGTTDTVHRSLANVMPLLDEEWRW